MKDDFKLKCPTCGNKYIFNKKLQDFLDEQIKPIDEHEWSDEFITNVEVDCMGTILLHTFAEDDYDNSYNTSVSLNIEDIRVMANAKGYKLTKIGTENG